MAPTYRKNIYLIVRSDGTVSLGHHWAVTSSSPRLLHPTVNPETRAATDGTYFISNRLGRRCEGGKQPSTPLGVGFARPDQIRAIEMPKHRIASDWTREWGESLLTGSLAVAHRGADRPTHRLPALRIIAEQGGDPGDDNSGLYQHITITMVVIVDVGDEELPVVGSHEVDQVPFGPCLWNGGRHRHHHRDLMQTIRQPIPSRTISPTDLLSARWR